MSWNKTFSGVGQASKKDAQRKLRAERFVMAAGQEQSAHNATLDAVVGVVALIASQYPDAVIEGGTSGHLNDSGGQVVMSIHIRPARESDLEPQDESEPESATDTAPVAESTTEDKKDGPTQSSGAPVPSNAAPVPVPAGNAKPQSAGQDGSTPVRVSPPAHPQSRK